MKIEKRVIRTDQAPKAIGPYSQAIEAGDFLFISGQLGIDPVSEDIVSGGVKAQTEQSLKNIGVILQSCGLGFDAIVKTTIFMVDLNDFHLVNNTYASFFNEGFPARSTIQVAGLPKGGLVEIEIIARIEK